MATRKREGIDYKAEGATPPHEKDDPTNEGYDHAAHSGPSRFGVKEGAGGVFGTSGGGTYQGGMHVEGQAGPDEPDEAESDEQEGTSAKPPAVKRPPKK